VLLRLAEFRARTFFELERQGGRVPWERVISSERPVALRVTSKKSKLYHEGAIAERLRAAIMKHAAASFVPAGVDEDEGAGDLQLIVVRVHRDQFTISADASGEALHRRGYRQAIGRAPLRETLAAALLHLAGWTGETPLLDPFCGSGTIPIEAALLARRIAPGIARADRSPRPYAFSSWPEHDSAAWRAQLDAARAAVRERAGVAIVGSDRDAGAIQLASGNAERAGVVDDVEWRRAPLSATLPPAPDSALITNPPYGVRVSAASDVRDLWAALGGFIRQRVSRGSVALLSPDVALERQLALPLVAIATTRNGGIPVRVLVGAAAPAEPTSGFTVGGLGTAP
jgi:putative N6-adenine-specific DNA methylase